MHESVMLWMIEHPGRPLGECARAFNITQSWLSQLIHSDLFQARLAELRQQQFEVGPLTVHERLSALAIITLDRLCAKAEVEPNPQILNELLKTATKSLGLGAAQVQINNSNGNVYVTDRKWLDEARAINRQLRAPPLKASEDDSERTADGSITDRRTAIDAESHRVNEPVEYGPGSAG